jgi:hypothetical protein
MKLLWEVADFVRGLRREMRFGELSRAPLRLLRLGLTGDTVTCDWIARPPDTWDADLRKQQRERNHSEQALRDAIRVRNLTFDTLCNLNVAVLRAFRPSGGREPPELIITGIATREAPPLDRVSSLVMRAKLYGFHFEVEEGILQVLKGTEQPVLQTIEDIHFQQRDPLRGEGVLLYGSE